MDLYSVLTFPIPTTGGVVGVLAIFRESEERPVSGVLDAIPVACHHLGRFLERFAPRARSMKRPCSSPRWPPPLTGLKNRREFDRAQRAIPRQPFGVLSVDIDGLKATNDSHGHAAEDAAWPC